MNATITIGWAPEPQTRGTIGLVWSCLATIFLCTWNAVHPNLPAAGESAYSILRRRVGYLGVALVAPEVMSTLAVIQLVDALKVQARSEKWDESSESWTLTQCFYLLMGGFVVKRGNEPVLLDPKDLMSLLESKKPSLSLPGLSEAEIMDHSKVDWVLKSLTLAQIIWFVTQVIGRAAQRLPVTTLELFTLGTISCALATYGAWWAKPFDVRRPTMIELEEPRPMKAIKRLGFATETGLDSESWSVAAFTILIIVLFGVLHLVGWRFHFPSDMEMWLWRASSIACVVLPLILLGILWLDIDQMFGGELQWHWINLLLLAAYVLFRLYMMVEMFASLRDLPADVYKTPQWSQYFPSFS